MTKIILASQSQARARILRAAEIDCEQIPAHIDEAALTAALCAAQQKPREIADGLAETKARKISLCYPQAMVIAADMVLALDDDRMLAKPATQEMAIANLQLLSGTHHRLYSAVAAAEAGDIVWRYVGVADIWLRVLEDAFIHRYVVRHWDNIRWSVGCYEVEGAGVQIFEKIEGDIWTIMGLPMLPLLAWMRQRGIIYA